MKIVLLLALLSCGQTTHTLLIVFFLHCITAKKESVSIPKFWVCETHDRAECKHHYNPPWPSCNFNQLIYLSMLPSCMIMKLNISHLKRLTTWSKISFFGFRVNDSFKVRFICIKYISTNWKIHLVVNMETLLTFIRNDWLTLGK